jgi:hypothetical protein
MGFMEFANTFSGMGIESESPRARYHCPSCHRITLAPLGQVETVCGFCGEDIKETHLALGLYRVSLRQREKGCPVRRGLSLVTEALLGMHGF